MLELILVGVILCSVVCLYIVKRKKDKVEEQVKSLLIEIENLKKSIPSDKDLQFLEFTVDMYIKYAKDFGIHSETQHEKIVAELTRVRDQYLIKNSSSLEQHPHEQESQ